MQMKPNQSRSFPKTRVALVDDHPWIRKGLRSLLGTEEGFEVCGEAEDAQGAIDLVAAAIPDLAIIDISIKGAIDGIELTRKLKAAHPHLLVLTLSLHAEAEYEARALAAGASAYLTKSDVSISLFDTLRRIVCQAETQSPLS